MAKLALILDACIAITFGEQERLDLVWGLESRRVIIAERAREEVMLPPASIQLDDAIRKGTIEVESIDLEDDREQEALTRYDARAAFRDRGDAEVIALASVREYVVGSDDAAVRRAVRRDLGDARIAGTLDILVWAIRNGRISSEEAEEFLESCDVGSMIIEGLETQGTRLSDLV